MINNEDIAQSLESPWTSIDLYFKGFHVKKSFPGDYKIDKVIEFVTEAISKGFEPSWNTGTSQEHLDPTNDFDKAQACQHPEEKLEVKIVQNGKNAGKKYARCTLCNAFVRWA